jgi:hypothetical protein
MNNTTALKEDEISIINKLNSISDQLIVLQKKIEKPLRPEKKISKLKAIDNFWDEYQSLFVFIFAFYITAIGFKYIFDVTFTEIPQQNKEYANIIVGFIMGTCLSTILGYFFGNKIKDKFSSEKTPEPLKEQSAKRTIKITNSECDDCDKYNEENNGNS